MSSSNFERVVLVTGANKGIGKEIVQKLLESDPNNTFCVLGCRNEEFPNVAFTKVDLDDASTHESAKQYLEEHMDGRCDVLINNAAVCFNDPTLYGKVEHTPFEQQADITVQTNFFGTLSLTRTLLPLLRESSSPRIINIASSAGRLSILPSKERQDAFSSKDLQLEELEGYMKEFVADVESGIHQQKGWPNTCYGASKVAIIAMTKVLARDEPKIMVNSVDPGYCATDQNNNQGYLPAERGAMTPFLLATIPDTQFFSGIHWFQEKEIEW